MLEDINSIYVMKNIFTYINDKAKLNLVKYNNKLKKALNLNLFYYQLKE